MRAITGMLLLATLAPAGEPEESARAAVAIALAVQTSRSATKLPGCLCGCPSCETICMCDTLGPCSSGCTCSPFRPSWWAMEDGGYGLYAELPYRRDDEKWLYFGYYDGTHYWPLLRDGTWGTPRSKPPITPPAKARQGRGAAVVFPAPDGPAIHPWMGQIQPVDFPLLTFPRQATCTNCR